MSTPENSPQKTPQITRHDGWTLAKQAMFLRQLSATHSVTEAARAAGMTRQSAYRLRSRLKGKPFDLAWEVAFHHSFDVLAHAALERALNGVEVPVFYQGEQVGAYRRYDERLTVALLGKSTHGGNPVFGRLVNSAEKHARDFEGLLGMLERGEDVPTGALAVDDPGELEAVRSAVLITDRVSAPLPCPQSYSDEEIMEALEGFDDDLEK
uniref:hypothetical protein n=1 Tax=uncultured Erythrobacter sp. TaxID=263913 RepID=UPI00260B5D98|nr:hypothetical protein [uncultured Erythrobacter sp.]